jgi:hypothetical protein
MTNEQLTQNVIELVAYKAKAEEEHILFRTMLQAIKEDVQATKTLTEDVHIMAINMENMQKVQDEMNKKVDALTSKEFLEYKENKKIVKDKILSAFIGAGCTFALGLIGWLINLFIMKGGV